MSASDQFGKGNQELLPNAADMDALIRAEHRDPFSMLGPHSDGKDGQVIRRYVGTKPLYRADSISEWIESQPDEKP